MYKNLGEIKVGKKKLIQNAKQINSYQFWISTSEELKNVL